MGQICFTFALSPYRVYLFSINVLLEDGEDIGMAGDV